MNHKVLGVLFLALLVAGVGLTYGIFTKKFTDYDEVTLQASKIGLQLPARADVKTRGVIVGEVLAVDATAEGAVLTLGIDPDRIGTISEEVTGSILPKTLFGEKYVELEVPEGTPVPTDDADRLAAGDRIARTEVSIEVEEVLADLYPLLRTVQPAELNYTLNALATALEGRGDDIGENLETLDGYLKDLNPQIPALVEDLRMTAEVSNLYADVLPEVGDILRNSITTTGTLEDRDVKLRRMFADVGAFSDVAGEFLDENEANLIRFNELSAAQLRVLAKYAPEYPCLTAGIIKAAERQAEAFRNFTLHINLETLPRQPRGYTARDVPRFGEDRGPACLTLPDPPWSQANPNPGQPDMDDGVDEPTGKGTSRVAPGWSGGQGYAGTPAETRLINSLLAPGMGLAPGDVDPLGALLVGPMTRGAEVSLR